MNILSIGGSDPSSGAGIQGDIKVFSKLNANCFTVITAITSQNTSKFSSVEPVSVKAIKNQIESILSDFDIDAVIIGMVFNSSVIKTIFSKLKKLDIPIILDPVIKSTTKGTLLQDDALKDYKELLIPLAYAITPNVEEAEKISKTRIVTKRDALNSALKIKKIGAKNVIITGNRFEKGKTTDFILGDSKNYSLSRKTIAIKNHGSGCIFSASLTYAIVQKRNIKEATEFAKKFTLESIKNAKKIGKGIAITKPKETDSNKLELSKAIDSFTKLHGISSFIPECQTNFVYSNEKPKSMKNIIGVLGRIVKTGKKVVVAGDLANGGSRHVATAVFVMNKKFPKIRSAVNIKYDLTTIKKFKKGKFSIASYDRMKEPQKIKRKENSSISWGINEAIKNCKTSPDVVFHTGDVGKEPMILVFGNSPNDVIDKISNIL